MFRQLVGWSPDRMDKRMDMQLDGWMNQRFDAIDIQLKAWYISKYVTLPDSAMHGRGVLGGFHMYLTLHHRIVFCRASNECIDSWMNEYIDSSPTKGVLEYGSHFKLSA